MMKKTKLFRIYYGDKLSEVKPITADITRFIIGGNFNSEYNQCVELKGLLDRLLLCKYNVINLYISIDKLTLFTYKYLSIKNAQVNLIYSNTNQEKSINDLIHHIESNQIKIDKLLYE